MNFSRARRPWRDLVNELLEYPKFVHGPTLDPFQLASDPEEMALRPSGTIQGPFGERKVPRHFFARRLVLVERSVSRVERRSRARKSRLGSMTRRLPTLKGLLQVLGRRRG